MRWPWLKRGSGDQLVLCWSGKTLAYVLAMAQPDGTHEVRKLGVLHQGTDSREVFVQRLQGLGLKGREAHIMLRPDQYQLLQIDTPAVPPEELRAAARYQIREMLQTHVDDVTIDVIRVGDGQQKGVEHSFVVAATNAVLLEVLDLAGILNCAVSVIDIQETAQRNLQIALAKQEGKPERADAALVLMPGQQALLTISANDELFYTRRFDVPDGFLTGIWGQGVTVVAASASAYAPVEEYVPDYAGDAGSGYLDMSLPPSYVPGAVDADAEKAQRLVVEVQRSLDVWDRTWSSLPLNRLRVYAGERSVELAQWLTQQLGQNVVALEVGNLFPGFDAAPAAQQALCLPLLGVLLRSEGDKS